ncbi:hypothetical protein GN958_ATG00007, partial [Phytophthora infestans]
MARTETSVRERIAKLKTWRDHSDWSAGKAAKELNVLKPTLLSWKKTYWHKLDTYEPGDAKREKGGGHKHIQRKEGFGFASQNPLDTSELASAIIITN